MHLIAHVVNMCMRAPRMRRHTDAADFHAQGSVSERLHVHVPVEVCTSCSIDVYARTLSTPLALGNLVLVGA